MQLWLGAQRCKGTELPKVSFNPGMIIRVVLHEADFQRTAGVSNVTGGDKIRTKSTHELIPGYLAYKALVL